MEQEPKTLQEAVIYFADQNNCREYLVARRWPNGVICPRCGSNRVAFLPTYNRWQCSVTHDARQFTSKTGTIMEDSPIGLDKWLMAMWLVVNCKNGVSSYEIHRGIGVTQKTAWFLDHRIRLALHNGSFENLLSGECEADESFIGAKSRNMRANVRARKITGTGGKDKTAVMGILERGKDGKHSTVRTKLIPNRKKSAIQAEVRKHIEAGSALKSYEGLNEFQHGDVDHAVRYVEGKIHTNGPENFWSLLKRGLHGTYVSAEPSHLCRYLDEQAYRFNNRKLDDGERFDLAVRQIVGKRLTWGRLTGKTETDLGTNQAPA